MCVGACVRACVRACLCVIYTVLTDSQARDWFFIRMMRYLRSSRSRRIPSVRTCIYVVIMHTASKIKSVLAQVLFGLQNEIEIILT